MAAGLALLMVLTGGYCLFGMPGMDHSSANAVGYRLVGPDGFQRTAQTPGVVVVNVHVPYDGEIPGTSILMPYDAIDANSLPRDRSTRVAVYCRTGTMSAIAVKALEALGFANITELRGGMVAWQAAGRPIVQHPLQDD